MFFFSNYICPRDPLPPNNRSYYCANTTRAHGKHPLPGTKSFGAIRHSQLGLSVDPGSVENVTSSANVSERVTRDVAVVKRTTVEIAIIAVTPRSAVTVSVFTKIFQSRARELEEKIGRPRGARGYPDRSRRGAASRTDVI